MHFTINFINVTASKINLGASTDESNYESEI